MKLDEQDISDLVQETEHRRKEWNNATVEWENMWRMHRYQNPFMETREIDNREQIVTADPYNIVHLVGRFVANEMRLEIPYLTATDEDDDRSEKMEEWLTAFWQRSSRQQNRNIIEDMTWYSAVRGRGAMQVVWVEDVLPEGLKDRKLPILARTLDPRNVGVQRGPYWTDYAYHKYKTTRAYVRQQYPKFKIKEEDGARPWQRMTKEYEVIDMYWMDGGSVMHAVTIEGEFAVKPKKTLYREIPIVEWYADGAPIDDELSKSLSILHPIRDLWKQKCDYASAIGTGILYYFDPLIKAIGFTDDIEVGPGEIVHLKEGQDLQFVRGEPNVPMAEKMMQLIQTSIDQATFPAVLYGEQPGGVQAGFAINSLATQARNRVNTIRSNLEGALEAANELVLSLVEIMGEDKGIEIWGSSERSDRSRPILLNQKDIRSNYSNEVRLIPEIPTDETGRIQIWLQMVKEGIISKGTMRNRAVNIPLPRDEETRIAVERALESPEMAQKHTLRAIQKRYKQDDWELLLQGTPLQQVHETEQQWIEQKRQEKEQAKLQRQEEKKAKEQEEMMAMMASMPPLMPPGMDGGMPGMPPDPMMGSMTGGGGMPPGMPPEGMMPPPMPPGGMQPPGMPGQAPENMGQMTEEMLGIPPTAAPGTFQEAMGEPLTDEEIMRQLAARSGPAQM